MINPITLLTTPTILHIGHVDRHPDGLCDVHLADGITVIPGIPVSQVGETLLWLGKLAAEKQREFGRLEAALN